MQGNVNSTWASLLQAKKSPINILALWRLIKFPFEELKEALASSHVLTCLGLYTCQPWDHFVSQEVKDLRVPKNSLKTEV